MHKQKSFRICPKSTLWTCYHDDLVSVYDFFVPTLEFVIYKRDLYEILQENSAIFEVQIQTF